jgi:hypothetical protein
VTTASSAAALIPFGMTNNPWGRAGVLSIEAGAGCQSPPLVGIGDIPPQERHVGGVAERLAASPSRIGGHAD